MPKSKEKDASKNIKRLIKKGMPQKQAVAVGLDEARRAGGDVPPAPAKKDEGKKKSKVKKKTATNIKTKKKPKTGKPKPKPQIGY